MYEIRECNKAIRDILSNCFRIGKNEDRVMDYFHPLIPDGYEGDDDFLMFLLLTLGGSVEQVMSDVQTMAELIENPEEAAKRIGYLLLNKDNTSFLAKDHPFRNVLDMRLLYFVSYRSDENGIHASLITDQAAERLEMTEAVLYSLARKNTPQILPVISEEHLSEHIDEAEVAIYSYTNVFRYRGAATMLYDGVLSSFASEHDGKAVYVLPTSVDEVFVIASDECPVGTGSKKRSLVDKETLYSALDKVNRLNRTETYLADSVYRYDVEKKKLHIFS